MMKKVITTVMSHQNMTILKIMMTEKNLKMKMPTRRAKKSSVKKEKKKYEKRRSRLQNSIR